MRSGVTHLPEFTLNAKKKNDLICMINGPKVEEGLKMVDELEMKRTLSVRISLLGNFGIPLE